MNPIFRSAMFGFNKADVSAFLIEQSKEYDKKLADKDAEIQRVIQEANARQEELFAEAKKDAEIAASYRKNLDSFAKAKALSGEVEAALAALAALEAETIETLTDLEKGVCVLQERVRVTAGFEKKAQKFDQLKSALSGIFDGGENAVAEDAVPENAVPYFAPQNLADVQKKVQDAVDSLNEKLGEMTRLISEVSAKNA